MSNKLKSNIAGVINNMTFKPKKKTGPMLSKARRHLSGEARIQYLLNKCGG